MYTIYVYLIDQLYGNRDYGHVWHFLRTFNLPYCSLYDQGYTSLGDKSTTFPNPLLARKFPSDCQTNANNNDNDNAATNDSNKCNSFWPAYLLSDWKEERSGRLDKKKQQKQQPLQNNDKESNKKFDKQPTAGLVIIGDEILNGFASESNLMVTTKALGSQGIVLKKVSIIPDEIDSIAEEVLSMSQKYDIVFTSGGIGPTHDDVTMKGIAIAFNQEIVSNPVMRKHLEDIQHTLSPSSPPVATKEENNNLSESLSRLALLPKNATLLFPPSPDDYYETNKNHHLIKQKTWPILQCENVFVLPGVPQYFANKITLIMKYFLPAGIVSGGNDADGRRSERKCLEKRKIILDIEEREFLSQIDHLVANHPNVKIGSYPYIDHPEYKTILTVEGFSPVEVDTAVSDLIDTLPNKQVVLRVEQTDSNNNKK